MPMRMHVPYLIFFMGILWTGCVKKTTLAGHKEKDAYTLADGSRFKHPPTWTVYEQSEQITVQGPEPGFNVHVFKKVRVKLPAEEALALWRKVHQDFSYPIYVAQTLPGERGFENIDTIVFDVPTQQSKSLMTIALSTKDTTYWFLIEATNELVSRRHAELLLIIESFRAPGAPKPQALLLNRAPKLWTDVEKKSFHDFIKTALHELKVPGAAIAIVDKGGNFLFHDAIGVKDINKKAPITVDTPFLIGSTSKALTTFMMARLVDQGIITWQTKLKDVLNDFFVADAALTDALDMRNSVSASTGMPRRDLEFIFHHKNVTAAERLKELHVMAPTTKMGETFQYSNHLVMAGGYAAAHAYRKNLSLEKSYQQAMSDLVFKPLGMKHTVISFAEAKKLGNASPHATNLDEIIVAIPLDQESAVTSVAPAGGLWSTVDDLARYVILELNDGELDKKRIIAKDRLLERRAPGASMGESYHYGLGLFIEDVAGLKVIGHDGNTLGFSSLMLFLPEQGVGLIILTNGSGANAFLNAAKQKFLELTFDAPKKSDLILETALSSEKMWVQQLKNHLKTSSVDTAWIKAWTGVYHNDTLGRIIIGEKKNGMYFLDAGEWVSDLATFSESNGTQTILLTTPPYYFTFQPQEETKSLLLDVAQQKYEFKFQPLQKKKK